MNLNQNMNQNVKRLAAASATVVATAGLMVSGAPSSLAADTGAVEINFQNDTSGAKADGFSSVDSGRVSFFDTNGADLSVGDFGVQSHGQALAAFGADSGIELRLAQPSVQISMAFGNDDPSIAVVGDVARLTAFRNGSTVRVEEVVLNRDDVMNQRIAVEGVGPVDRVVFQYLRANGTPFFLTPIVDDIRLAPLCSITGNSAANVLNGTNGPDVICGGAGADRINGRGGNDVVFAGSGSDIVNAGTGADTVSGAKGNDLLRGAEGPDILKGQEGRDRLDGGKAFDRCQGGPLRDTGVSCEVRIGIP